MNKIIFGEWNKNWNRNYIQNENSTVSVAFRCFLVASARADVCFCSRL